ncbi:arginyl-tRNA synthetase [Carbonactinospora thermoautotrophica]|uniref:Arginine--tRNA ligase n=1 Tax=Carbonactinospora thermoautotrophica TaxID=1469144 RepID=A0A132NBS9_9ACTN|nr:arginine--tRNA ligase [Carbonactinospora thermoautotrophica]KWX04238.1 arginyl-tRNA synthetase [Carbonactinospora thermoautotrophica]KWX07543.1 arginyl-tRNA synthetase [Carbonactinospora thermoautotrophica]
MTPAELSDAVLAAVRDAVEAGELSVDVPTEAVVERPKNREHGDYATNMAMRLAKPAGKPPREVAEILAKRLRDVAGIASVEIAGPGFLNFRLEEAAAGQLARTIVLAGEEYGRSKAFQGLKINLEFVSANPTGPIHIGGVRWAAVGDALARLLEATGADVTREYYINDAGVQVDRFAASLLAAAHGEPTPEDGYAGQYIAEIAQQVVERHPGLLDRPRDEQFEVFRETGLELMKAEIKRSLADFGVHFDVWFSERTLHERGEVARAVERLRAQGHVYERDGAVWLRTTDFGDDKDRVLIKSDGMPTYFAADAAYYLDKRDRGHEVNVYMLGADHHGYVQRLKAIAACAGDDPDHNIEVLIGQMVRMVKNGQEVRLSKRAGNIITLDDVVEAIGVDAARYALARSSADSVLTLDVDLLTSQTNENPVYYVQYVAARTASVARNARELGVDRGAPEDFRPELLTHEKEGELLGLLAEFPRVVATAAELREPHRVARYLEELAGAYHRFYDNCRILPRGDEEVTDLMRARLWLNDATRQVIANGLHLLGVSAPERM